MADDGGQEVRSPGFISEHCPLLAVCPQVHYGGSVGSAVSSGKHSVVWIMLSDVRCIGHGIHSSAMRRALWKFAISNDIALWE